MMDDTDLEVLDVVCHVSQNRNAHNEQVELDFLYLFCSLICRRPLHNLLNLLLFLLSLCQLLSHCLLLPSGFPIFEALTDLLRHLLVTVVEDLYEKISTFIYGRPVKHEHFQNVANDTFMVYSQIKFH